MPTTVSAKNPPLAKLPPRGAIYRKLTSTHTIRVNNTTKYFPIFTVMWVDRFGVPFSTPGFSAAAYNRNGLRVATASFDNFGVVQFSGIPTRTLIPLTLRTFDRNGVLFRTKRVPAGLESFAIIG